jgi:alkylhydroperoxidase family enzyme
VPHEKPSEVEVEQRHDLIAGQPPRILPLDVSQLSQEALTLLAGFIALNNTFEPRDPAGKESLIAAHAAGVAAVGSAALEQALSPIVRTMMRHPQLFARHVDISAQLFSQGALSARDRELLVLRVAWLLRAPFEWGEHVHIAKTTGVSAEEVERITEGSQATGWSERDAALLRAVEELLADAFITDATWATLAAHFDDKQLIELPIVVGQYQTVAYYQNSLRVAFNEGNSGLKAR